MAIYNTGLQVNRALAAGATPLADWRLGLLSAIGAGAAPTSVWDCLARGALHFVPILAVSALAGLGTERLFARMRGRAPDHTALAVIALLFSLCLPPTLPLWKAALGSGLAFAVGKEIFGGLGRNLLNPPLTGLAFLYFAYPGDLSGSAIWVAVDGWSGATPLSVAHRSGLAGLEAAGLDWSAVLLGDVPGAMGATSALACAFGASVLLATGVASWRILAGGLLGLAGGVWLIQLIGGQGPAAELPWTWHALSGGFAFGLVFLATDPVSSATTNPGRLLYGALIGFLIVVIRLANPAHREGVMLAILLGNVFAPLIDQVVGRIQMGRRRDFDVR
jgi:Na+-transporting NADH:ubiquinone oxidoreductase subunit B